MRPAPRTDLHWLAFRYVCGELSGDEAVAFETLLAHDQGAREAVAAAVELAAAVERAAPAASPDVLPMRRPRVARALAWTASAAAACLALAVGLVSVGHRRDRAPAVPANPAVAVASASPSRDVALAWSGLRREDVGTPTGLPAWLDEAATVADADLAPAAEDGESGPPPWLLVAASLPQAGGVDQAVTKED
jgi:hypothetical protein